MFQTSQIIIYIRFGGFWRSRNEPNHYICQKHASRIDLLRSRGVITALHSPPFYHAKGCICLPCKGLPLRIHQLTMQRTTRSDFSERLVEWKMWVSGGRQTTMRSIASFRFVSLSLNSQGYAEGGVPMGILSALRPLPDEGWLRPKESSGNQKKQENQCFYNVSWFCWPGKPKKPMFLCGLVNLKGHPSVQNTSSLGLV